MTEPGKFADQFDKSANAALPTPSGIDKLEKELNIQLPNIFKRFMLCIGKNAKRLNKEKMNISTASRGLQITSILPIMGLDGILIPRLHKDFHVH